MACMIFVTGEEPTNRLLLLGISFLISANASHGSMGPRGRSFREEANLGVLVGRNVYRYGTIWFQ